MTDGRLGPEEIEHRFGFHKATIEGDNATLPKHAEVRILFRQFAEALDQITPGGRAKSVMFTELENASMWAHKAIAETAPVVREIDSYQRPMDATTAAIKRVTDGVPARGYHLSDCAVYSEPAENAKPCDCGLRSAVYSSIYKDPGEDLVLHPDEGSLAEQPHAVEMCEWGHTFRPCPHDDMKREAEESVCENCGGEDSHHTVECYLGQSKRVFEMLNHPETEGRTGIQLYSVYELVKTSPNGTVEPKLIKDNLTLGQAKHFIEMNGEHA